MKAALCVLSAFICVGLPTMCLLQGNRLSALKATLSQAPVGATTIPLFSETAAQPVRETTGQPVRESTVQPVRETTAHPVRETTGQPVRETTEQPVSETTAQPVRETTEQPVSETTAQPVRETTAQPVSETTAQPVRETTAQRVSETTAQPVSETTAQSVRGTTGHFVKGTPSQPRVLIYFVPVPRNAKHPIGYYAEYMKHLCEKIKRAQYNNVGFVGDMSSIVSLAEPCKSLAHGPNIKFSSLAYDDVVSPLPENGTCILKMGLTPLQRAVVKIWLNKVNVLCEAAQEEPDAVTTLIDVNVGDGQLKDAALRSGAKLEPGKLGVFRYKDKGTHGGWFGHPACYGTVKIWAKFMSIRGRDCPRILAPYKEVLAHASDGGCPCFDEEWLMTRLFEKQPNLFCVQGIQGTGYFH